MRIRYTLVSVLCAISCHVTFTTMLLRLFEHCLIVLWKTYTKVYHSRQFFFYGEGGGAILAFSWIHCKDIGSAKLRDTTLKSVWNLFLPKSCQGLFQTDTYCKIYLSKDNQSLFLCHDKIKRLQTLITQIIKLIINCTVFSGVV